MTEQEIETTEQEIENGAAIVEKVTMNGVTRPREGSMVYRIWAIADAISRSTEQPATRAAVLEQANSEGLNPSTTATQFARWRKYNGLVSTPEERAAAKTAKAEARAKADAEKEVRKAERAHAAEAKRAEKAAKLAEKAAAAAAAPADAAPAPAAVGSQLP